MKRRITAVTVLLVSILASLAAAEAVLRFASARWLSILDVEMWRYAKQVKKESDLPGVVEEHRANADALLMGVRVRTDARGFRLPDPATEAMRRPENRTVIALGDSLTFGWGVPEGQTWADQLERRLNNLCRKRGSRPATVLNAGIGNSNTSMQLARYRARIRPLRPDWVVLGFFINDAEPDPVPSDNPLIWQSALAGLASTRLRQGREVQLRDYRQYYGALYQDGRPGWERQKQALRELGALLRGDGTAATLILLPELHEPRGFGSFAPVYARVAGIAREAGFEVIDPSAAFPPGPGDAFWVTPGDAHPNAPAQEIFAAALTRSRYACGRGIPTTSARASAAQR